MFNLSSSRTTLAPSWIAAALCLCASAPVHADGGIGYTDIAALPSSSIDYRRVPSARNAAFEAIKQQPTYTLPDVLVTPLKPRGAPGVALVDYDNDGDLDIYATNGPGASNSLYQNQLAQTGALAFVDVGASSGAGLVSQDSNSVCAGDIDNDGDTDLYVLGAMEANRLLENQGDGSFVDITSPSQTGAGSFGSVSCTMADIDQDGYLDIFVGNAFDLSVQYAIFAEPFAFNQPNQLLRNRGDNTFADVTASSGILNTEGFNPSSGPQPTITWAVIAFDYDGDGDVDLLQGDDQAAYPFVVSGSPIAQDRGFIQLFENDGAGNFTTRTVDAGLDRTGQWMGLSAGDVNCDGTIDLFGSNFGDYTALGLEPGYPYGRSTSRFLLNEGDGTFTDPADSLVGGASVFGWGTSMFDYDNDADLDIIYHGGLDLGPYVEATNDGVLLQNQGECTGNFKHDTSAKSQTDHQRRTVHGVAIGDLNNDGFDDIVSASAFDFPAPIPLVPFGAFYNSEFDNASFVPVFTPTGTPGVFVYNDITMPDGTLSIEISSANNGNKSTKIRDSGYRRLALKRAGQ